MYNPHTGAGFVITRLKYVKSQGSKQHVDNDETDSPDEIDRADDIEFFRTFVYNKNDRRNYETIRKKIRNTIQERSKMCENQNINIQLHFPCLLMNYDLVRVLLNFKPINNL